MGKAAAAAAAAEAALGSLSRSRSLRAADSDGCGGSGGLLLIDVGLRPLLSLVDIPQLLMSLQTGHFRTEDRGGAEQVQQIAPPFFHYSQVIQSGGGRSLFLAA